MELSLNKKIFKVSEVTFLIKGLLEETINGLWIDGEISNIRSPSSGHTYFTLKDEYSQIKVVLFKFQKLSIKFELEDGMRVILHGSLTVYETKGEYQIIADYLEPKGTGALQKAYEQLKERLSKEGIFDEARKRPIPLLPKKIGIITSPTGAVIADMLNILNRRYANIHILIYPVRVQGEGAAEEISSALFELNKFQDIDVIIVARGGGSIEDLWAFNEECVARAIYNSRIPVISAVGHEIDFTIADFAADMRAPTPSAAAEIVAADKKELLDRLSYLKNALLSVQKNRVGSLQDRVISLKEKLSYMSPEKRICQYRQEIDDHMAAIERCIRLRIEGLRKDLSSNASRLNSLSPLAILGRGFSITQHSSSKKVIKDASDIYIGERLDIRFNKGKTVCKVEEIING